MDKNEWTRNALKRLRNKEVQYPNAGKPLHCRRDPVSGEMRAVNLTGRPVAEVQALEDANRRRNELLKANRRDYNTAARL